ncbi:PAS domain-containing protein [Hymenobacter sp. RP-2-7]|uniref:PAS domain-containing protein n=1 Tax=Hymenobacter polaris TaxID=2682546 RepID=A0A7Y0FQ31_9BACT|nr:PAS domain-containing protein [Hymenobacter polaris]NML68009.1 PAS domain-containing protein [Hymenobacter polaris]
MHAAQSFSYATSQVWQPAVYAHPDAPAALAAGSHWGQQLARLLLGMQGVYIYDHRARMMCYVSEGVAKLTGVPVAEFTGERNFALIHPDDLPIVQEATRLFNQFIYAYRRSIGPDIVASIDYRLCRPDGSCRRVLRHNSVLEQEPETGNPVLVAAILTDITAHKHTTDVRFHLNHPDFTDFVARQPRLRAQPILNCARAASDAASDAGPDQPPDCPAAFRE